MKLATILSENGDTIVLTNDEGIAKIPHIIDFSEANRQQLLNTYNANDLITLLISFNKPIKSRRM